jgi:protein involved in polysaccharide export with SLBB domain
MQKLLIVKSLITGFILSLLIFSSALANTNVLKEKPYEGYLSKSFNARSYILGPNDVFSMSVYDSPEFDKQNIKVQPDGKITVTPLGSFYVSGMTIEELQQSAEEKLKFYLKQPKVSIILEKTKPFLVYVSGAVINPGSYELQTDVSGYANAFNSGKLEIQIDRRTPILSNVLVAAGGIAFDADLEHVKIANKFEGSEYEINLFELIENGNNEQDIYLMSGDSIHIPRLPTPFAVDEAKYKKFASSTISPRYVPVKVFGYVNSPGLIKLDPGQSLNLNSAITAAGGYLRDSAYAPKKVFLSRADTSGKLVTKIVDPMENDITIMPNDIIYIPEKTRPLIGKAFDYLGRLISPANNFAGSYNNWALMFKPTRYQVIGK